VRRALDALYAGCGWAAAGFIVAICATVTAQVALNTLDKVLAALGVARTGLSVPSYSDFTGFFLAAASFLALAATLRAGAHIRVTLLIGRLGPRAARVMDAAALALALAVSGWFAWFAARLSHESWMFGDVSTGIVPVPLWPPQAAVALGLAALTLALADELVAVLGGRAPSYAGKGEGMLADPDHVSRAD
jgi:TRAP-type C4-dicarboxylate transport system permease small subunit